MLDRTLDVVKNASTKTFSGKKKHKREKGVNYALSSLWKS